VIESDVGFSASLTYCTCDNAMELVLPEQISLSKESRALISDVEETARRVNDYRPLPRDVVRRIQDLLLPERVHHSNAIEGNTLEFHETRMILETGNLIPTKLRDALEARNLGDAVRLLAEIPTNDSSIHCRERFLEIHGLVLRDIDDQWAGRFRDHAVKIQGAAWTPPSRGIVPTLIDRVLQRLANPGEEAPLLAGVWTHWALAAIHPFRDGNGRMSRLWQDLVFYQRGLTCALIVPQQRREYYDALQSADEGGFDPLLQLVGRSMLSTFDRYLAEVGKEAEAEQWATELAGEADVRTAEAQKLEYMRWTRAMERLRFEFIVHANKISERANEISIQVREYPVVDQQAWENLRSGLRAEKTWFFTVTFHRAHVLRRYCFFFATHFWSELDATEERRRSACLLVSEFDVDGTDATRLDQIQDCPISLREVFVAAGSPVRRRVDFERNEEVYDRDVDPGLVAREFYRDVILRRLG